MLVAIHKFGRSVGELVGLLVGELAGLLVGGFVCVCEGSSYKFKQEEKISGDFSCNSGRAQGKGSASKSLLMKNWILVGAELWSDSSYSVQIILLLLESRMHLAFALPLSIV